MSKNQKYIIFGSIKLTIEIRISTGRILVRGRRLRDRIMSRRWCRFPLVGDVRHIATALVGHVAHHLHPPVRQGHTVLALKFIIRI